jgi:hypothetical protein
MLRGDDTQEDEGDHPSCDSPAESVPAVDPVTDPVADPCESFPESLLPFRPSGIGIWFSTNIADVADDAGLGWDWSLRRIARR